ncbi:MAG: ATP-binding cassette domain-containing protein [Chloroflexi bacterium]|nr:ATP-binding cassette domain-containing protein [Chloroflexota bacterium]
MVLTLVAPPAETHDADPVIDPVYRLQDVMRIFREGDVETIALRGIDLDIGSGTFVSLMGRSGSGKSTLLGLLAGADRPSAGKVMFRDTDLGRATESDLQRLRGRDISLLFQADNLAGFLSVVENMSLAASLAGRDLGDGLAMAILDRVGLSARVRHRPGQLSGGEQQRAALACVLAAAAPVVLMDEPTAELDSRTAQQVLELVRQLQVEHHLTVVLATHDAAVAAGADRIVTLRSGHITDDRRV